MMARCIDLALEMLDARTIALSVSPLAALNGCSHRTGRRFSKVTTWTSARSQGTVVTPAAPCATGCPISAKATESNVLVGVIYRFF
jgi:hypothetical protein